MCNMSIPGTPQWRSNRGFSRFKEPGPRPLGAPARGHNLFYLQDATNQDLEETEICLLAFSKTERAYCIQFSKTLTDSFDEELCNMAANFVNKYSDDVSDESMTSSVKFSLSVLVPQNVSNRHKRTTTML